MSIAKALGLTEEEFAKTIIPEERIKHIGNSENSVIETSSAEVVILAKNEEDKRTLENVFKG